MSTHTHQWVFLGELALTVSAADIARGEIDFRRIDVCMDCALIRVQFNDKWWVMPARITKEYLATFEKEESVLVKNPPPEYRVTAPVREQQRLGRGLSDIRKRPRTNQSLLKSFFKQQR